jgi:hypothetical protein
LPPAAAEYSSERHVIFTISRSEIVKMTCLSKHNLARSAVKNLFTQPRFKFLFGAKRHENTFHTTPKAHILPPQTAKAFSHNPK